MSRRPWDLRARAEAERLDREWTGWTILYGTGSRRFHAIATWPAPEPLIISAATPDELERRMREAETGMLVRHDDRRGTSASHGPREPGRGAAVPYVPYRRETRGPYGPRL
ncbi:hypothetical protein, partial [Streptomyces anulatus]|uniref:hypothetical protein n=1 Tax=Streptomyces anulatus TaxID=1892 RepID=UPI003442D206